MAFMIVKKMHEGKSYCTDFFSHILEDPSMRIIHNTNNNYNKVEVNEHKTSICLGKQRQKEWCSPAFVWNALVTGFQCLVTLHM